MDIALLAPVPLEHLIDGARTCDAQGKVAFGSRAFLPFARLRDAGAEGCDVYIYASDSPMGGPPKVTWKARYLGFVEAKSGAHPDGMVYRPASTGKYPADNDGHWFLFWEVADLAPLAEAQSVMVKTLRGDGKKSNYKANYVPEGPVVIQSPT